MKALVLLHGIAFASALPLPQPPSTNPIEQQFGSEDLWPDYPYEPLFSPRLTNGSEDAVPSRPLGSQHSSLGSARVQVPHDVFEIYQRLSAQLEDWRRYRELHLPAYQEANQEARVTHEPAAATVPLPGTGGDTASQRSIDDLEDPTVEDPELEVEKLRPIASNLRTLALYRFAAYVQQRYPEKKYVEELNDVTVAEFEHRTEILFRSDTKHGSKASDYLKAVAHRTMLRRILQAADEFSADFELTQGQAKLFKTLKRLIDPFESVLPDAESENRRFNEELRVRRQAARDFIRTWRHENDQPQFD